MASWNESMARSPRVPCDVAPRHFALLTNCEGKQMVVAPLVEFYKAMGRERLWFKRRDIHFMAEQEHKRKGKNKKGKKRTF